MKKLLLAALLLASVTPAFAGWQRTDGGNFTRSQFQRDHAACDAEVADIVVSGGGSMATVTKGQFAIIGIACLTNRGWTYTDN